MHHIFVCFRIYKLWRRDWIWNSCFLEEKQEKAKVIFSFIFTYRTTPHRTEPHRTIVAVPFRTVPCFTLLNLTYRYDYLTVPYRTIPHRTALQHMYLACHTVPYYTLLSLTYRNFLYHTLPYLSVLYRNGIVVYLLKRNKNIKRKLFAPYRTLSYRTLSYRTLSYCVVLLKCTYIFIHMYWFRPCICLFKFNRKSTFIYF